MTTIPFGACFRARACDFAIRLWAFFWARDFLKEAHPFLNPIFANAFGNPAMFLPCPSYLGMNFPTAKAATNAKRPMPPHLTAYAVLPMVDTRGETGSVAASSFIRLV